MFGVFLFFFFLDVDLSQCGSVHREKKKRGGGGWGEEGCANTVRQQKLIELWKEECMAQGKRVLLLILSILMGAWGGKASLRMNMGLQNMWGLCELQVEKLFVVFSDFNFPKMRNIGVWPCWRLNSLCIQCGLMCMQALDHLLSMA